MPAFIPFRNTAPSRRRPGRVACRVLALLLLAGGAHAQSPAEAAAAAAPDLTDPQRWNETAYAISLLPPDGWTPIATPRDGNDFAWGSDDGIRIAFKIAYSGVPMQLDQAELQSLVQMGFALDGPRLQRRAQQQRIANRPGSVMFFDIDPPDGSAPWFYAHAVVMLEPFAAAVVKVQSAKPLADQARARFEAVLASLHVPTAAELEERRRRQVDLGVAWLTALPTGALIDAVPQERWYRLSIQGQNVGHRRVTKVTDPIALADDPELHKRGFTPPGTAVVIQDRRQLGDIALDRSFYAYTEDAGEIEIWELKQTVRQTEVAAPKTGLPSRADGQSDGQTWVATGTRGPRGRPGTQPHNIIKVIQEAPPKPATVAAVKAHEAFLGSTGAAARAKGDGSVTGRTTPRRWLTPPTGYLGQVQALGLPAAMPPVPGTAFVFYAWDPAGGDLSLRTVRVTADTAPDAAPGGYVVHERPAPSSGETRHRFAADGTHLQTVIPGGLTLTPTTAEALSQDVKDAE